MEKIVEGFAAESSHDNKNNHLKDQTEVFGI